MSLTRIREARGRVSLLPRWIHQTYAFLAGYFWLPCPLCGRQVGGHEWRSVEGKPASIPRGGPGVRRGICPVCTYEGRTEHCRPGRCLALTCCSYECSQGRCPSIPTEHRKPAP